MGARVRRIGMDPDQLVFWMVWMDGGAVGLLMMEFFSASSVALKDAKNGRRVSF